jgi:MYXO-CTERM domain-containing protein
MAEGESYTISLVQDWETQTRTEVKGVNATSVDTQLVGGTVNLTPEPTAMAVLGLGSLLALRRRRR